MIEAWCIVFVQQRLVQPAVGIKTGGIQDRVLGAEKPRDGRFQSFVQILRAADEAHRSHAKAVAAEGLFCGFDQGRVVGQTKIIIGAEIEYRASVIEHDFCRLRAGDDALGFEQPGLADIVQRVGVALDGRIGHGKVCSGKWLQTQDSTTFPQRPASIRSNPA